VKNTKWCCQSQGSKKGKWKHFPFIFQCGPAFELAAHVRRWPEFPLYHSPANLSSDFPQIN